MDVITITGDLLPRNLCVQGFTIREEVTNVIKETHPHFNADSWILNEDLKKFKLVYLSRLSGGDWAIAEQVAAHQTISDDMLKLLKEPKSSLVNDIGNWLSSYKFGVFLMMFVAIWVVINLGGGGFDNYPYNLLDLTIGVVATLQSLFIMISQSKADEREQRLVTNNYRLALKNEVEITVLREKLDHVKDVQVPIILEAIKNQKYEKERS